MPINVLRLWYWQIIFTGFNCWFLKILKLRQFKDGKADPITLKDKFIYSGCQLSKLIIEILFTFILMWVVRHHYSLNRTFIEVIKSYDIFSHPPVYYCDIKWSSASKPDNIVKHSLEDLYYNNIAIVCVQSMPGCIITRYTEKTIYLRYMMFFDALAILLLLFEFMMYLIRGVLYAISEILHVVNYM